MAPEPGGQLPVEFRIDVPPGMLGGVYANVVLAWHTAHEFTLDFGSTLPAEVKDDLVTVPAHVVARVKLPPTVLFDVLRTLNENMTLYEKAFGEIKRPEPPGGGS